MNATPAPALNMNKQYRAEIKSLRSEAREIGRDAVRIEREARKEITRIIRESEKMLAGLSKRAGEIEKRRLILAGRLAK
jgi:F0F1-type ATP synthase membrane subunit b/b'